MQTYTDATGSIVQDSTDKLVYLLSPMYACCSPTLGTRHTEYC